MISYDWDRRTLVVGCRRIRLPTSSHPSCTAGCPCTVMEDAHHEGKCSYQNVSREVPPLTGRPVRLKGLEASAGFGAHHGTATMAHLFVATQNTVIFTNTSLILDAGPHQGHYVYMNTKRQCWTDISAHLAPRADRT